MGRDEFPKCRNTECALRFKCWRYLSPFYRRHLWEMYKPGPDGACDHFLPLRRPPGGLNRKKVQVAK
jgi:hypothetical protein